MLARVLGGISLSCATVWFICVGIMLHMNAPCFLLASACGIGAWMCFFGSEKVQKQECKSQ